MNKYSYEVNWTEPSCDCPFVPYYHKSEGLADSEEDLKETALMSAKCYPYRENVLITNIKLIEEDADHLKPKDNKIVGYSTRVGPYIMITAPDMFRLAELYNKITGESDFDESLVIKTETTKCE